MSAMASQITSLTIVYSTVCSGSDQRIHQSSAPLAFVRGIHQGPLNSPHKGPLTRKMFPFYDVIMWVFSRIYHWFYEHDNVMTWKRMMTSSNGNIFRVTGPLCEEFTGPGEFPTQRPMTRSFDVFFDLRLNKRLNKQPWGWWFETPSWSIWCQCNGFPHHWYFVRVNFRWPVDYPPKKPVVQRYDVFFVFFNLNKLLTK